MTDQPIGFLEFETMDTPLRILVIEDEKIDFLLVERHLRKCRLNAQLQRIGSIADLTTALHGDSWDVVLCDYNMPGMHFAEVMEILQAMIEDVPVILLSGAIGEERAVELLKLGINDFVLKDNLVRLAPAITRARREVEEMHARRAAEKAIREKDVLLKEISSLARVGGWELDHISGMCFWTEEVSRILEAETAAEVHLGQFLGYVVGGSRQSLLNAIAECVENRKPFDLELEIVTEGGQEKWIRVLGKLAGTTEETVRIRASVQDVTERKFNEQALRESEQRFRYVAQATNDTVWDWDLSNDSLWWGDGIERQFGYLRSALSGTIDAWIQMIHPADRDRVMAGVNLAILGNGEHWTAEYRFRRASGEYAYILDRGFVVRDANCKPIRMVGSMTDLTERRQYEDKLREQATLLDEATDAILVRSLDDRILYWNKAAERQYGWKAEEVLGRHVVDVLYSVSKTPFEEALAIVRKQGDFTGRITHTRRDGSRVVVQSHWVLVKDFDGAPKSILAIHTDLSDKIDLEERLFQAQKLESLGQLTGGISHDFNNLLTVIIGNAELLKDELAEQKEYSELAHMIQSAGEKGAQLTHRLLAFSRRQPMLPRHVDPVSVINGMRGLLERTLGESVLLDISFSPDTWVIFVDPVQLESAILNLCINARDAMPKGGTLSIEVENIGIDRQFVIENPGVVAGEYVQIAVSDTGTGMSPDIAERAFEPYFTTKERGSGLGLSMVYGFAKQSNGHVSISTAPGKGTIVKIFLPKSETQEVEEDKQWEGTHDESGSGTILLVEDEDLVRCHVKSLLTGMGYRVMSASNGAEAMEMLRQGGNVIFCLPMSSCRVECPVPNLRAQHNESGRTCACFIRRATCKMPCNIRKTCLVPRCCRSHTAETSWRKKSAFCWAGDEADRALASSRSARDVVDAAD